MGRVRPAFFFISFSLLILSFLSNAEAENALSSLGPKFDLRTPKVNLGYRHWRSGLQHRFEFANAGDEPLTVNVVNRSCGCIAGELTSTLILPGESGALEIGVEAKKPASKDHFKVVLATNDPQQPEVLVELEVYWTESVEAVPRELKLDPMRGEAPVKFDIVSLAGEATGGEIQSGAKILSARADPPSLGLREVARENENDSLRVSYEVLPKGITPPGAKIVIETDSREFPKVEIPVLSNATALAFLPAAINFGVLRVGAFAGKSAEIKSRIPGISIANAKSADPRVDVTIEPAGPGAWRIQAKFRADGSRGRVKSAIEFFDQEGAKQGEIPVLATILPAE
jgi:hypothetical protein